VSTLPEPFQRFAEWFELAKKSVATDPNAMTMSSVGPDGRPSSRVVLLKGFDERGFVFYTNLESRKGRELRAHPFAALCFHWKELERQVRIEGPVRLVPDDEADAYFASRPRGSQLGAWASKQSGPLPSREQLEEKVAELDRQYQGQPVPRPAHWSGFLVVPDRIEFWTSRISRLHDRELWLLQNGTWNMGLLYP